MMYLEVSMLITIIVGAYLIGLVTIPIVALIILKNPSRMHTTTRTSSRNMNKRSVRQQKRGW